MSPNSYEKVKDILQRPDWLDSYQVNGYLSSQLTILYTGLVLGGVSLNDLIVKPHVSHSHSVLSQRAGLIGADGGGGAEGLDGFQVFHQAVLGGHTFCSQGQTHRDGSQKTFGYVGYDDT